MQLITFVTVLTMVLGMLVARLSDFGKMFDLLDPGRRQALEFSANSFDDGGAFAF